MNRSRNCYPAGVACLAALSVGPRRHASGHRRGAELPDGRRLVEGTAEEMDARRLEEPSVPLQRAVQWRRRGQARPERAEQEVADQGMVLWPSVANPADDGTIRQGWRTDHDAPVLWTDWSGSPYAGAKRSGLRPRQEIFAHVPGAADVKTGIEPLFAWVR